MKSKQSKPENRSGLLTSLYPERPWFQTVTPDTFRHDLTAGFTNAQYKDIQFFSSLSSITPSFALPVADLGLMIELLPRAAAIAFVGLFEAISIGRSFAVRHGEKYDSDQEIAEQGMSNLIGANECFEVLNAITCPSAPPSRGPASKGTYVLPLSKTSRKGSDNWTPPIRIKKSGFWA